MIQADLVYARVGGTSLRLDLYTPSEAPSGLPTLLYLHGGAWAMGDKSDAVAERLGEMPDEGAYCGPDLKPGALPSRCRAPRS